ncbi:MAG: sensor protein [Nocardioides sp.]|nr:sensor protein [Nocardioides sp.]
MVTQRAVQHRSGESSSGSVALAFEHLPIATALVDVADVPTVVAVNRALSTLAAGPERPLLGSPFSGLVAGGGDRLTSSGADTGRPGTEERLIMADGRRVPVLMHAAHLPGADRPTVVVQFQLQERQQEAERALRSSEKRLQDMADNVNTLIYLKSAEGHYILINRHYERVLGEGRDDVVGKTDFDLWPTEIATAYRAADEQVLAAGVPMEFEEPIPTDGVWGMWLSLKFPLFDEDGVAYAVGGISTDISGRNRAEMAIREARDEAERANRAKSEFLSRMSHELRTPLNSILGFGQLLQLDDDQPAARENVDRIVGAGRHLLSLINEVLEISRIEAGAQSISVEPVDACGPLVEAIDLVRPLAAQHGVELAVDLHGALHRYVLADYQRLKQVLLNVLMNAIKYNRPDGMVTVSAEVVGDLLRYLVTDTGVGIDESDLDRIFQPFERLGAEQSETEGTGLGLALSKSLVELMGGAIGVSRSVPGRGSVFFVELPTTSERSREPEAPRKAEALGPVACADLASLTVLYIEDNLANLDLVRKVLARMGEPTLIPAMQGQLGVELAALHTPDLVLLDLHLPDTDGEEVLRRLQADPRTSSIPVVVLSADAMPAQIERLKAGGAADYVTKPLDIPVFLAAVKAAVGCPE